MRISDWSSDVCSSDLHAAGQDDAVELIDLDLTGGAVDLEAVSRLQVVERLCGAAVRGHEEGLPARRFHGLPRLGELHLLDALVGDEEGDLLVGQLSSQDRKSTRLNSSH